MPEDFGLAAMALIFVGIATILTDLSLGAALVQRPHLTEEDRSTAFWTTIAAGLACTVVGIACAPLVAWLFDTPDVTPLFAAASASFAIVAFSATQVALLTREMQFRDLQLREIAGVVAGAGAAVAVALSGGGAWAIIAQALVAEAVAVVLVWRFSPWRPRRVYSKQSLKELGSFGGKTAGARVLGYLNLNADNFLIAKFLGAASLGIYALAYNVMFAPMTRLVAPIQQVLFPAFARLAADPARVGAAWLRGNRIVTALSVPAFVGLAVVAPDFVPVVLGDKWEEVVPVLQLLCVAGVAQSPQSLNWSVLQALGRPGTLLRFMVFSTAVTVTSFAVGLHWGIVGVAAGFAIARVGVLPIFTSIVCRASGTSTRAFVRSVAGVIEAAAGMGVAAYALRRALVDADVPAAARLAIVVVAGAAVYAGLVLWREPRLISEVRSLRSSRAEVSSDSVSQ